MTLFDDPAVAINPGVAVLGSTDPAGAESEVRQIPKPPQKAIRRRTRRGRSQSLRADLRAHAV